MLLEVLQIREHRGQQAHRLQDWLGPLELLQPLQDQKETQEAQDRLEPQACLILAVQVLEEIKA